MPFCLAFSAPKLSQGGGLLVLVLGTAGLCVASLLAGAGLGARPASPGRRALAAWAPILVTSLVALYMGSPEIALGITFGTSVAILSTVIGSVGMVAPVGPAPVRWRRMWPFTLAAGLMVFMVGFSGFLLWQGAMALGVEGLVVLSLWREQNAESSHQTAAELLVGLGQLSGERAVRSPGSVLDYFQGTPLPRWGPWVVVFPLTLVAAYATTAGALSFGSANGHISTSALAATLLSVALTVPMIHDARRFAMAGHSWVPVTTMVGIVLLNLCALLPLIAMMPYAKAVLPSLMPWSIGWPPRFDFPVAHPLAFPYAAWRVDTLVVVVLSVMLLPVSMGKWNLGREEAMLLVAGYCVYLVMVTVMGTG